MTIIGVVGKELKKEGNHDLVVGAVKRGGERREKHPGFPRWVNMLAAA